MFAVRRLHQRTLRRKIVYVGEPESALNVSQMLFQSLGAREVQLLA
jgi:hypothetical protein